MSKSLSCGNMRGRLRSEGRSGSLLPVAQTMNERKRWYPLLVTSPSARCGDSGAAEIPTHEARWTTVDVRAIESSSNAPASASPRARNRRSYSRWPPRSATRWRSPCRHLQALRLPSRLQSLVPASETLRSWRPSPASPRGRSYPASTSAHPCHSRRCHPWRSPSPSLRSSRDNACLQQWTGKRMLRRNAKKTSHANKISENGDGWAVAHVETYLDCALN